MTKNLKNKLGTSMQLLIVGGGFGGIKTAIELAKNPALTITLVSDREYFTYYPALYETATGHAPRESWISLKEIFKDLPQVTIVMDKIVHIDHTKNIAFGEKHTQYSYDKCVLALGVVTAFFGIEGLEQHSYGIKTVEEIAKFKDHLHRQIISSHKPDKHYVVVGGGPTGVELAAALIVYLKRICKNHQVDHAKIRVELVEAAPRILPKMSERASLIVEKRLKKLGVLVVVGKAVNREDADSVEIAGKDVPSKTVVWTSGVSNNPFFAANAASFEFSKNGRVVVDEHLRANKDIFVIGDNAFTPFSGLAQTALHDALFLKKVLSAELAGKTLPKYSAVMPPVVVPAGENWAILEWKKLTISGWIAGKIRSIADLIGYSDILPIGLALGTWRAEKLIEEDCEICKNATKN